MVDLAPAYQTDNDDINEDWPKVTWDLLGIPDVDALMTLGSFSTLEDVRRLASGIAYQAAPPDFRASVEAYLAAHPISTDKGWHPHVIKGEEAGHPFRGNQYEEGESGPEQEHGAATVNTDYSGRWSTKDPQLIEDVSNKLGHGEFMVPERKFAQFAALVVTGGHTFSQRVNVDPDFAHARCHWIATERVASDPERFQHCYGYARGAVGKGLYQVPWDHDPETEQWVLHSWVLDTQTNTILEPAGVTRTEYFGVTLKPDEEKAFVKALYPGGEKVYFQYGVEHMSPLPDYSKLAEHYGKPL